MAAPGVSIHRMSLADRGTLVLPMGRTYVTNI